VVKDVGDVVDDVGGVGVDNDGVADVAIIVVVMGDVAHRHCRG